MRISKNPDVRKGELILAAEELFRVSGYEETTVSDIVRKVGVAQGTFYYYFKSKDEVLNAVIDHYLDKYASGVEKILEDQSISPVQKVQIIANDTLGMHVSDRKFIDFLHSEENLVTHQKFMIKSFNRVIPLITEIIEQGIKAGVFNVDYPEEMVEMMVYAFGYLEDSLAASDDDGKRSKRLRAAESLIERALGLEKGVIHINPSMACSLTSMG